MFLANGRETRIFEEFGVGKFTVRNLLVLIKE